MPPSYQATEIKKLALNKKARAPCFLYLLSPLLFSTLNGSLYVQSYALANKKKEKKLVDCPYVDIFHNFSLLYKWLE